MLNLGNLMTNCLVFVLSADQWPARYIGIYFLLSDWVHHWSVSESFPCKNPQICSNVNIDIEHDLYWH